GRLREPLVLKDAQGGFAGFSGYIWTISPEGNWRREPFLNRDVRQPDALGRLSGEELRALADALAEAHFLKLPPKLGDEPSVNPHIYELKFGQRESQLVLKTGDALPAIDPKDAEQRNVQQFIDIIRTIQRLTDAEEPPQPAGGDR
ncbi:MAG: hypothetical protein KY476_12055, partial [Planctomycetes bacterium]|nr:hypothetical protein [Planctomycetota bacterium]